MNPVKLIGREVQTIESTTTGERIPVIASKGLVFSAWAPSPEELADLNRGKSVWLIQRGSYIPEMTMIVGERKEIVPKDVILEASKPVDPVAHDAILQSRKIKKNLPKLAFVVGLITIFLQITIACATTLAIVYTIWKVGGRIFG